MTARCPGELELARALGREASPPGDEGDPAVVAHIAGCAACRGHQDSFGRAIALARQLPLEMPSRSRREEVRTAVLAAGSMSHGDFLRSPMPARRRMPARTFAIAGLAAAAALLLYVAIPSP